LVRINAGQEAKPATIRKATLLFAQMIRLSGRFKRGRFTRLKRDERRDQRAGHEVEPAKVDIVERFALRLLDEWINDQCVRCEGRGIVRRDGRYICLDCAGPGKRPIDEQRVRKRSTSRSMNIVGTGLVVFMTCTHCPIT